MFLVNVMNPDTGNTLGFGFNEMSDALKFMADCIECGEEGIVVSVHEDKEEE